MADEIPARIAMLEEMVSELRSELARAKVGGFRSMRDTRRCPACESGQLLHIPDAKETKESGLVPAGVHHVKRFWGTKVYGAIEHFVCRTCGLIESHAKGIEEIIPDGVEVIEIVPELPPPADGPFR